MLLYRRPGDPRVLAPGAKGQDAVLEVAEKMVGWSTRRCPPRARPVAPSAARRAPARPRRTRSEPGRPRAGRARDRPRAGPRRRPGRAVRRGPARVLAVAGRRPDRAPPGRHRARRLGARGARPGQLLRPRGRAVRGRRCWPWPSRWPAPCAATPASRPRCRRPRPADGHPVERPARGRARPSARPRSCARWTSAPAPPARRSPRWAWATWTSAGSSRSSTPTGLAASDDRTRVRLSTQAVARRGDRVETGTQTRGGHAGFELLETEPERWPRTPRARR